MEQVREIVREEIQFFAGAIRELLKREFSIVEQWMDRMEQRFDGVEQRFDGINQRFDGIEQRFDRVEQRLDGMQEQLDRLEQTQSEDVVELLRFVNKKITASIQNHQIS